MLIPVFMYHDIRPDDYHLSGGFIENAPYVLSESEFRKQIEFIASAGMMTRRICDLCSIESERISTGEQGGCTILSFDDGDASNYSRAFRLLVQHGLKATFFITTDFVERPEYVSWEQLKEMQAAGMEIGSHSVSHPVPSLLDDSQFAYELSKSKEILEGRLDCAINSFSLPRGFGHPGLERLAREAGYSAVCTSRSGYVNTKALALYDIDRIAIKRTTRFEEFLSYTRCKGYLMRKRILKEKLVDRAKGFLGVERYDRIRKSLLGRMYG